MSGSLKITLDIDAVIAAARSASLDYSEIMKRIEINMPADAMGRLEAFHAKQAEADLQYRWGMTPWN